MVPTHCAYAVRVPASGVPYAPCTVELKPQGREWGFAHAALLRKSPYHLGLLSKHPLRVLSAARETADHFAHGMLCAEVLNVTL